MNRLILYGVAGLAVIGILFGVYKAGEVSGFKDGNVEGAKSRQAEVDDWKGKYNGLVSQESQRNKDLNTKIEGLEKQASDDADEIAELNKKVSEKRTTVITEYIDRFPEQAQVCAVLPETAVAINALIDAPLEPAK